MAVLISRGVSIMEQIHGVYLITCTANNKVLIGEGRVISRLKAHKSNLKNNRHYNKHLQAAYNLYGKDSFLFELLFYCEPEKTKFYEDYLCRMLDSHNSEKGFNKSKTDPNRQVFKHHATTIEELREIGRKRKHSKLTKEKCRKASSERRHTDKSKKKMSDSRVGIVYSEEHNKNVAAALTNNPKISKPIIQMDLQGNFIAEFPSIIQCSRDLGFSTGQLCDVLNGNRKTAKGFKWKYKNKSDENIRSN